MALGKPEYPDHVRGARQGATMSNYFHTSRWYRQGSTNNDVDRFVKAKLQEERKFQEEEWKRGEDEWRTREDNIRGEKMISELPSCLKLKKCGRNFK